METKKKVLISQPMGTRTAEQVKAERKEIQEYLESLGYEILDNIFTDTPGEDITNDQIFYLTKAVDLMSKADAVYFMDGWKDSRGCNIEFDIAITYHIPIINADEVLGNMDFGNAIFALKCGFKVARRGWNGKDMFLYHVPADRYPAKTEIAKEIMAEDGKVDYGAYIAMKTVQGYVVPWLASQTDILSEDWYVVV